MPPEVLIGTLSEKADIWSTAVLMIKLLTGVNPFNGSSDKQIVSNIQSKALNFKEKPFTLVSDEARDLLSKMFERNMHKRPTAK